jgi:hypothetical protein
MYNELCPNKTNYEKKYLALIWKNMFSVPASIKPDSSTQKLKLFGMFGKPFINDIGQGLLGNCYLLATLGTIS